MTDYNLLAKQEIDKYYSFFPHDLVSKEVATTAIQGIIDALEKMHRISLPYELKAEITHYTTLKQAIQDYKP